VATLTHSVALLLWIFPRRFKSSHISSMTDRN
jgi:hypothetical protein